MNELWFYSMNNNNEIAGAREKKEVMGKWYIHMYICDDDDDDNDDKKREKLLQKWMINVFFSRRGFENHWNTKEHTHAFEARHHTELCNHR